ncbi:sulfite exporter TauE/SafE family protein, partial [Acinetobacter baumannii]
MLQIIFTGLTIGLVSGFHCVGMCGPIAFSLPVQDLKSVQKTSAVLLYNLGRIFTYTLLGLISGITGRFIYV